MDKEIVIEEYDDDWFLQFKKEKLLIRDIMGDDTLAIEHIGSTSVAGLGAKPILDIAVGVKSLLIVWLAKLNGLLKSMTQKQLLDL